jgi:hypothetical protein
MQAYFVGAMYDERDAWRRPLYVSGVLEIEAEAPAPPDAFEDIGRQIRALARSLLAVSQDASIDMVGKVVEATCDDLREQVFDGLAAEAQNDN